MKRILAMSAILAVAAQLPAGETRRIEYSRLLFGSCIAADEQELDVSSLGAASALRAVVLDGDSPDAYNDIGAEERVAERETVLSVREGKVTLPPHSVSIIFFGGNGNEQ